MLFRLVQKQRSQAHATNDDVKCLEKLDGGRRKRALDIMYLLTNEKGEWMEKLQAALRKDGWNTIVTSNDLELDSEGVDTNMAIDMDIARKAAVFVGNGWSSFTSNINHRRLVDGKEPISIRFW
ncbi:hypothetical protein H0H93_016388 [Arthromyces matolae]|nr:hypothetical protein H0H93_016388 [Arthromyces matolae]